MFHRYLVVLLAVLTTLYPLVVAAVDNYAPVQNMDPMLLMRKQTDANTGTISGRVMQNSYAPLVNGTVLLFDAASGPPPAPLRYMRVADNMVGLDSHGKFTFEVKPGTYYVMATDRPPDRDYGPPRDGGFIYFVSNASGNPAPITIAKNSNLDIGVLTKAMTYSRDLIKNDTTIEGVVEDNLGNPVPGAKVIAFAGKPDQEKPVFAADQTGKDGKFILRVHEGGSYKLKTRGVYGGGRPLDGEAVNVGGRHLDKEAVYGVNRPLNQVAAYSFEQASLDGVTVSLKTGQKLRGVKLPIKKFLSGGPPNNNSNILQ